jgi:hypothetical protein
MIAIASPTAYIACAIYPLYIGLNQRHMRLLAAKAKKYILRALDNFTS